MSTITVVFHQADKVYRVISLEVRDLTTVAASEAFKQGCRASVHLDGERVGEEATTLEQLFQLVCEASTRQGFHCMACSR